jgi:hypothetical protein
MRAFPNYWAFPGGGVHDHHDHLLGVQGDGPVCGSLTGACPPLN